MKLLSAKSGAKIWNENTKNTWQPFWSWQSASLHSLGVHMAMRQVIPTPWCGNMARIASQGVKFLTVRGIIAGVTKVETRTSRKLLFETPMSTFWCRLGSGFVAVLAGKLALLVSTLVARCASAQQIHSRRLSHKVVQAYRIVTAVIRVGSGRKQSQVAQSMRRPRAIIVRARTVEIACSMIIILAVEPLSHNSHMKGIQTRVRAL